MDVIPIEQEENIAAVRDLLTLALWGIIHLVVGTLVYLFFSRFNQ